MKKIFLAFVLVFIGAACFAVSFAAWQSGVSSVEAYGSVGLFYVDFAVFVRHNAVMFFNSTVCSVTVPPPL